MAHMKIRERLVIAFLIIITIPIILISAVGSAIISHQKNAIEQSYDVESNTIQILIDPIKVFNRLTRGIFNSIQTQTKKDPDRFEDAANLDAINQDLKNKFSFLVVKKGENFTYIGNEEQYEHIKEYLRGFGADSSNVDGGFYVNGKYSCLIKQQDFYYSDGTEGCIYIVTATDTVLPQLRSSAIQFISSFIIIICFTAIILILWIYQGIIRPLNALQFATIQMRDGNLDYSLDIEDSDEISELCKDFDQMRIRLKKLIEDRIQYEEDSRELISNISHDLKTPLTAIKGYAEGIIDGVADTPEKMDRYLKTIYTKANDMTALVDELSFYSKIDTNSVPYNFIAINVNDYFTDCINELTLDLEVKNIDLGYFNYVDESQEVWADVEQLKRVVNNIIGNSAKYMDKSKGIINLRIEDEREYVKISIEDNGKGIESYDTVNIFERFYRADSSRNSSQGGTGLGLSISKKIIEDHGGYIGASGKIGVGTTIYFTLMKLSYAETVEEESENPSESGEKVSKETRSLKEIKTKESKGKESKAKEVKPKEVKPKEVKPKEVKPKESKVKEIWLKDNKTKESKTKESMPAESSIIEADLTESAQKANESERSELSEDR